MKVFVILLVLIGFAGIAFGQYMGDKLPPGTIFPDTNEKYVFPPNYVDFYYSDPRFDHYFVTEGVYRYDIPYMISNGIISNMDINCSDVELVLNVKSSGNDGWITLALPRILIDSKFNDVDDVFFVLLDSKETHHSDFTSEKLRVLLIPFSNNTSQVNVIGLNYPEQMGANACDEKHEPPFSYLLSPLKQNSNDIVFNEIQCKENLILVQKYDGSPACVKSETAEILKHRGWADRIMNNFCFGEYLPVCGEDNVTYGNQCYLEREHVELKYLGECENFMPSDYELDETEFLQIKNNMENTGYHICDIQLDENTILIELNWIFEGSEPEKMILSNIPSNVSYEIKYLDGYADYFISKDSVYSCEGLENEK